MWYFIIGAIILFVIVIALDILTEAKNVILTLGQGKRVQWKTAPKLFLLLIAICSFIVAYWITSGLF